jgi:hypothetical protein
MKKVVLNISVALLTISLICVLVYTMFTYPYIFAYGFAIFLTFCGTIAILDNLNALGEAIINFFKNEK